MLESFFVFFKLTLKFIENNQDNKTHSNQTNNDSNRKIFFKNFKRLKTAA